MQPVLLIIDMQNDFFTKESLIEQRPRLTEAINELVGSARRYDCPIIWVVTEYAPDLHDASLEMKKNNIAICIEGTEGAQILDELEVNPQDLRLVKKRYSAFFGTNLDDLLARLGATHLIMAGINTHACIRTAAVDAYQHDYEVIFASYGIGSYDKEHHEVSLRYMIGKIGVALTNEEIARFLKDQ